MTRSVLQASRRLFQVFKEDSVQIPTQRSRIPSFRPNSPVMSGRSSVSNTRPDDVAKPSGYPSVLRSFEQLKLASVRTCCHLSGRYSEFEKIQHSNASVWTTWLYRPDASQSSRRIRFSFADTDMGRQLQPSGHYP
jgi:hypothetical protein